MLRKLFVSNSCYRSIVTAFANFRVALLYCSGCLPTKFLSLKILLTTQYELMGRCG